MKRRQFCLWFLLLGATLLGSGPLAAQQEAATSASLLSDSAIFTGQIAQMPMRDGKVLAAD